MCVCVSLLCFHGAFCSSLITPAQLDSLQLQDRIWPKSFSDDKQRVARRRTLQPGLAASPQHPGASVESLRQKGVGWVYDGKRSQAIMQLAIWNGMSIEPNVDASTSYLLESTAEADLVMQNEIHCYNDVSELPSNN